MNNIKSCRLVQYEQNVSRIKKMAKKSVFTHIDRVSATRGRGEPESITQGLDNVYD